MPSIFTTHFAFSEDGEDSNQIFPKLNDLPDKPIVEEPNELKPTTPDIKSKVDTGGNQHQETSDILNSADVSITTQQSESPPTNSESQQESNGGIDLNKWKKKVKGSAGDSDTFTQEEFDKLKESWKNLLDDWENNSVDELLEKKAKISSIPHSCNCHSDRPCYKNSNRQIKWDAAPNALKTHLGNFANSAFEVISRELKRKFKKFKLF